MARPEGIIKKTKNNDHKKYREAKDFAEGKRVGRPKQQWVPSIFDGAPLSAYASMTDLDRMITEETIANGRYIAAHWEKTQ